MSIQLAACLNDRALKKDETRVEVAHDQQCLRIHLGQDLEPCYPKPYEFFRIAPFTDEEEGGQCAGLTLQILPHSRLTFLIDDRSAGVSLSLMPLATMYRNRVGCQDISK
jgi:hypothetical protein